ncbi:MAG: ATP-dependent Clp protease proteolytic subunit [Chromatiaceae bacterium]|nr:ATP-dependent Clp protease proteolytic subunit [Chromatiaceae bacterium]MCF7996537.1 ATP-dependent Clp protease proteolytic subunit [Chromatiaceae bacterium]MCF8017325.1 ATP-dependent Clp protease proteolytic subunit [Chromatiaceae bacterium]
MDTILLYSEIKAGDAARFRDQLAKAGPEPTVRINSPGGSVFEGLAITNAIQAHGKVRIIIDGLAASIASLIACAGRRVEMAENALFMLHQPWTNSGGTADDLRRDAAALDQAAKSLVVGYASKSKKPAAEITALMAAETWLTADEALAEGFVDVISAAPAMAAHFDLTRFQNIPDKVRNMTTDTTEAPSNITELKAGIERDTLARINARNETLKVRFDAFCRAYKGDVDTIRAVYDDMAADLDKTPDQFTDKVLAKLAEGQEPIAGAYHTRPGEWHDRAPSISYGRNNHHGEFAAAAVDGLLQRGGVTIRKPHPAAADMRGMSMVQVADTMLAQSGRNPGRSPIASIKAAMTTSDFPALLANTADKALMLGYEQEPASHRIWTRETFARDFKAQTRVAISEAPELLEKPEAAEYTAGSLSDRGESFKLVTYGRMMVITRESLVNDDLNAFTRFPMAFGASAARKEADVVYALLTSNPTMGDGTALFHADHGNLLGTVSLNVAGLSEARTQMRKQKGPNGGYLNPVPRYLLVPAALETAALVLVASQRITEIESADREVEANALQWIRDLMVVVDPRLDDASATAWYLAADPVQIDTAERVYLDGQRGVFTEEDQEFSTDNFRMKARLDFAAAVPDWAGLVKSVGA